MKSIAALALIILCSLVTSCATPPEGSYKKTCRNTKVESQTLKGECRTLRGEWTATQIPVDTCSMEIQNIDGQLACVPHGDYAKTCNRIKLQDGVLSALCRTRDLKWIPTQLSVSECKNEIHNVNGQLTCGPAGF